MANIEGGKFDKFLVINYKFLQFLSMTDQINLFQIIQKVNKEAPKIEGYKYLVINTDEPYADEVIEILKKNGHWG